MAADPVCGMRVGPNTAAHTSTYQVQAYYFCARGCKRTFEANPRQFASKVGQTAR